MHMGIAYAIKRFPAYLHLAIPIAARDWSTWREMSALRGFWMNREILRRSQLIETRQGFGKSELARTVIGPWRGRARQQLTPPPSWDPAPTAAASLCDSWLTAIHSGGPSIWATTPGDRRSPKAPGSRG